MFIKAKYLLFDFDGVFADTEPFHYKAFASVCRKYGIRITWNEYKKKFIAYDDKDAFKNIFKMKRGKAPGGALLKKLLEEKSGIIKKMLPDVKPYEDAVEFIKELPSKIKCGIVSGALKSEILFLLKKFGIYNRFIFILSAEDLKIGKPSSYPYLYAFRILKKFDRAIKKNDVVVVEDSINGVISAKNAGFRVLAVTHTYPSGLLKANYVTGDLRSVRII